MLDSSFVMYEEDHRRILATIEKLARATHAKGIFLVDRNGQMIAEAGEMGGIDTTSLASLAAGNVAATSGLAKVIGEEEFPVHFHQGRRDHLHISTIGPRAILVVVFDDRSSLGLVRLRVRKTSGALAKLFEEIAKKAEQNEGGGGASPFAEITDDDIDNLFSS